MSHLAVNGNKMNSLGKWKLYNLLSVIDQWRGPRILQFTNRNLPQTRLLDFPSLNKIEFVWNWKVNFQTEFCLVFVQWNGCPDYLLMRVTTCLLDSTKDTCIYCYRDDFTSTKGTILLYQTLDNKLIKVQSQDLRTDWCLLQRFTHVQYLRPWSFPLMADLFAGPDQQIRWSIVTKPHVEANAK